MDSLVFDLQRFADGDANPGQGTDGGSPDPTPTPQPDDGSQDPGIGDLESRLSGLSAEQISRLAPIRNLIESVRSQEKNKLYSTLQAKEAELKKLQERAKQLEDQLKATQTQSMTEQELIQKRFEELTSRIAELERQAHEARLSAYREKRLREIGDEIIPELVQGNSEEEIEQSIQFAIQKYREIKEKVAKSAGRPVTPPTTPPVTNPPTSPTQPISIEQIRNMSYEEWKKHREQILKSFKPFAGA